MIYQERGDHEVALQQYEKSKEIKEQVGDIAGLAISFGQIGNLHLDKENYPRALRNFLKAFVIFAKIGSPNVNIVKKDILTVKEKIPAPQFAAILAEFDIPPDLFENISAQAQPPGKPQEG